MDSRSKEIPLPKTPPSPSQPNEATCMAEGAVTADGRHETDRLFDASRGDKITVYEATPGSTRTSGSRRIPRRREE